MGWQMLNLPRTLRMIEDYALMMLKKRACEIGSMAPLPCTLIN